MRRCLRWRVWGVIDVSDNNDAQAGEAGVVCSLLTYHIVPLAVVMGAHCPSEPAAVGWRAVCVTIAMATPTGCAAEVTYHAAEVEVEAAPAMVRWWLSCVLQQQRRRGRRGWGTQQQSRRTVTSSGGGGSATGRLRLGAASVACDRCGSAAGAPRLQRTGIEAARRGLRACWWGWDG